MKQIRTAVIGLGLMVALAGYVAAESQRASPHEQVSATVGGKKVTLSYGRPYKKGRVIFGGLVPFGEVWRAGADEATTLATEGDLTIGTLKVPKGTYALFVIPAEKEWTLVLNKQAEQWGAYSYDAKKDLGRTAMKVASAAAPLEQFTISIDKDAAGKSSLKLAWDTTVVTVAISGK